MHERVVRLSAMGRRNGSTSPLRQSVVPKWWLLPVVSGPAHVRQWVLTCLTRWRSRLAHDDALLGRVTRIFLQTVEAFYARRA